MLEKAGFEKGGQAVVLGGATIAGFFAAACSLPFDFVKTRIQKMEPLPDGTLPYKGPVDCAMKTLREEGFLKFYTGFPTYCLRCAVPLHLYRLATTLVRCSMSGTMAFKLLAVMLRSVCWGMARLCSASMTAFCVGRESSQQVHVCRIAPHVTMTLVALEALKAYEKKIGL